MRLQGAISPRVEARLDEMLGHPETCPHGNPIDAATAKRRPAGSACSDIGGGHARDRSTGSRRRPRRTPACSRTSRRARSSPGAPITILARSRSLDSMTLEGPLGRATLGLRPAALVRVLPGDADPNLFHHVPVVAGRPRRRDPGARAESRPDRARARPGRSISGPRGRRCSTSCTPATSAGRSSCASRTPTSRAARSRSRRTSSTACTGWASTGTRARRSPASPPAARTHRTARWSACRCTPPRRQRLLADDLAYPCYCTPEELEADRKAQEAAKQPPRYVGRCARLTPTSARRARPRAAAARCASASGGRRRLR